MKDLELTIEENVKITKDTYLMSLSGDLGEVARAGQFIDISIEGLYLRRPISVLGADSSHVEIIYKVVGKGTDKLSEMAPGEKLDALIPLGNGFDIDQKFERPLLVAGGIGMPPIAFLAKELKEAGKDFRVALGFRSKDDMLPLDTFYDMGVTPIVALQDMVAEEPGESSVGAPGEHGEESGEAPCEPGEGAGEDPEGKPGEGAEAGGFGVIPGLVTDAMEKVRAMGYDFDYVFCCGPKPMLRAVYEKSPDGQFSFEERMGCGFGACMGCSAKTKNGYKRICKDGPVLFRDEIVWED